MTGTIYLVTGGSYSDYRIEAAFSTRPNAQRWIDAYEGKGDQVEIEEYPIDPPELPLPLTTIVMAKDGKVRDIWDRGITCLSWGRGYQDYAYDGALVWGVTTADRERAVKVVNEKRAIILAHNAWGDNEHTKGLFETAAEIARGEG